MFFVANRLLESNDTDDNELGRSLRDEVGLKSLRADRIDHMLFTVSGNGPHGSLKDDLDATETNRDHYVVNIHIEDHQDFIAAISRLRGSCSPRRSDWRTMRRMCRCGGFRTSAAT